MKIIENTPFSVFSLRLRADALEGALLCIPAIKAPLWLLSGYISCLHTLRITRFGLIASLCASHPVPTKAK